MHATGSFRFGSIVCTEHALWQDGKEALASRTSGKIVQISCSTTHSLLVRFTSEIYLMTEAHWVGPFHAGSTVLHGACSEVGGCNLLGPGKRRLKWLKDLFPGCGLRVSNLRDFARRMQDEVAQRPTPRPN